MNEDERSELDQLKQRQSRLEKELSLLSKELEIFETRLNQPGVPKIQPAVPAADSVEMPRKESLAEAQPSTPAPIRIPPPPIIPPAPAFAQTSPERHARSAPLGVPHRLRLHVEEKPNLAKGSCKACGRQIEFPVNAIGQTILCPHCGQSTILSDAQGALPVPPPIPGSGAMPPVLATPSAREAAEPVAKRSLEMRLGTYWLVRVGIVLVLTGLVFFGNYAYQKVIVHLGPAGKVCLLYLASALLLGAGWWWQRKTVKESLKNYAQVLFAGGLATLYFTTYAMYHLEPLKVIASRLLDGLLLLGCAAFMVWIADRKKSQVLAVFAVLLAYYSSVITHVGLFTLYSNLVLTAAAVCFLVRNRWAALTFASLVATYAAYGFWRFFDGSQWHWASPEQGLWQGVYFLMFYWLLFTAGVFLSKDEKFAGEQRAGFITLNNGAFLTMFLLTMLQVRQGGFWKFSLIYGTVLLGMSVLAGRILAGEPLAKNSYLTQGLLLVTIGFITKYAGMHLALILGAESVVLLMLGQQRKSLILQTGAYIVAGLAVGWGIDGMKQPDRPAVIWGAGLGALMICNALLTHHQTRSARQDLLRAQPAYFTVLALVIWLVVTYDNASRGNFPLILAAEGLALTLSIYVLRVREIALLSQGYLLLAQIAWLFNFLFASAQGLPPWWNPILLIAISLALSHWWQRQKVLELGAQTGLAWQAIYALAIIGVLYCWLNPKFEPPHWLAFTSVLTVGLTAYGVFTRAWFVALWGQIFMLLSVAQFALQLWLGKPDWPLPLAPIAALGLLSYGTVKWFERKPDATGRISEPLLQTVLLYRWTALVMSIWWVCQYVPARERIWLLALLGLWVFLWAGWQRSQEALWFSAAYTATALALFWLPLLETSTVYWPNLVVIIILLAQRQFARRLPERYPQEPSVHNTVIIVGGLSLWLFLSRWVDENFKGFYLTASWSAFALVLFTAGIVLRERMYRWLGLTVLACSLGRIIIFDVWKLETLYRVLSFMALGIVLLVLGFIYTKYEEKIKEWL